VKKACDSSMKKYFRVCYSVANSNYIDKWHPFGWHMKHIFYCAGNHKEIAWSIQTEDKLVNHQRDHHEMYMDKITNVQSKYVALHVGIFWGIGTFIIKNNDTVKVMLDSKFMYDHLSQNATIDDSFIENKTKFINLLIQQRKLNVEYSLIDSNENISLKLIN